MTRGKKRNPKNIVLNLKKTLNLKKKSEIIKSENHYLQTRNRIQERGKTQIQSKKHVSYDDDEDDDWGGDDGYEDKYLDNNYSKYDYNGQSDYGDGDAGGKAIFTLNLAQLYLKLPFFNLTQQPSPKQYRLCVANKRSEAAWLEEGSS